MSQQPEALRLAEQLRDMSSKFKAPSHERGVCNGAIQELRRLHALNQELLEALLECVEDSEQAVTDYVLIYGENHRPQRLEAMRETVRKARAAIAKAEGQQ